MIGIFDSGSGGLTVLKEVKKLAPHADIMYFGDLKNAPYGNKSREELGALTVLGMQRLIQEGATSIISACNSVSVSLYNHLLDFFPHASVKITEMVGPTVSYLQRHNLTRIILFATKATIDSGVYQRAFSKAGIEVTEVALPKLAEMIEQNASKDDMKKHIVLCIQGVLFPSMQVALLGCTHYPLIQDIFEEVLHARGFEGLVFNPAHEVASYALQNYHEEGSGHIRFLLSQDSKQFRAFVTQFFPQEKHAIEILP